MRLPGLAADGIVMPRDIPAYLLALDLPLLPRLMFFAPAQAFLLLDLALLDGELP